MGGDHPFNVVPVPDKLRHRVKRKYALIPFYQHAATYQTRITRLLLANSG
jgi:hypothetical protein